MKKYLIVLFFTLILVHNGLFPETGTLQNDSFKKMIQKQNPDKVIKLIRPLLENSPKDFHFYYYMGKALYKKGMNVIVPVYFRRALESMDKARPKNFLIKEIYETLFTIYTQNYCFEQANDILEKSKPFFSKAFEEKKNALNTKETSYNKRTRKGISELTSGNFKISFPVPPDWVWYHDRDGNIHCRGTSIRKNGSIDIRLVKIHSYPLENNLELESDSERKKLVQLIFENVRERMGFESKTELASDRIRNHLCLFVEIPPLKLKTEVSHIYWIPLKSSMIQIVTMHTNPDEKGKLKDYLLENLEVEIWK